MTYTQLHQGINWIYFRFTARDQIQDCQGIMALERSPCILLIMRKVAVFCPSVWLQTLDLVWQEGSSVIYKYYRIPLSEVLCYWCSFHLSPFSLTSFLFLSCTKPITYGITGSVYLFVGQSVYLISKTIFKIWYLASIIKSG
jgi:hypothetical protein